MCASTWKIEFLFLQLTANKHSALYWKTQTSDYLPKQCASTWKSLASFSSTYVKQTFCSTLQDTDFRLFTKTDRLHLENLSFFSFNLRQTNTAWDALTRSIMFIIYVYITIFIYILRVEDRVDSSATALFYSVTEFGLLHSVSPQTEKFSSINIYRGFGKIFKLRANNLRWM